MATGGDSDLIQDEDSEDDAGEDIIKEFEGSNATIMFHFFKNTDLKRMSEKYNCLIKCEPPEVPMLRKLELRFKSKYGDGVERHIVKMMQEMSKFESKKFTFDISSASKLTEYLKNPDLLDSPVCYICDIASGSVDIIGRSYEELMQAEHKLKLHLGLIKTLGRQRIQRHISDSGNGSDPSTTGLPERTYADIAKQSSIRETNPDPSLKTSVSSLASKNRFSMSYNGGSTQTSRQRDTYVSQTGTGSYESHAGTGSYEGRTNSSPDQRSFSGQDQAANKYLYDDKKQEEKSNWKTGELKERQSNMGNQRDTDVSQTGTGSYGRQSHAGQSSRTSSDRTNRYNLKNPMKLLGEQTFKWGGRAKVYELGSEITIKIFKGDITKTNNMDAIVCCIDQLFLKTSYIDNAITTAGGEDYRKNFEDMEKLYFRSLLGSIFKCKAGKLGVHHVMHVVMEPIDNFTEMKFQAYSSIIKMVLQKANEWKYPKLVIPLFGTDAVQNAGKPEELKSCCVSMLKGLDDYLADKGMKVKVTDVHLVNNNEAVCQTLINVFDEASGFVHHKLSDESMSVAWVKPVGIRPKSRSWDRGIHQGSELGHPASRDHRFDDRSHGDRQPSQGGFESSRRGRGLEQTQEGNRHSDSRYDRDGGRRGGEKNNSGRFASEMDFGRNRGLEGATADYAEIVDSPRMNSSDTDSGKETPPLLDRPGKKKGNLIIIENR